MAEKKTTVVLEAQAKGFEKAERQVQKTLDAMDPSEVMRKFDALSGKLDAAAKAFKTVGDSADFGKMTESIREMTRAVGALAEAKKKDREESEREAKRHSFMTGLVQGAGVADYIPPNLKMARYAAGQAAGRTVRGGVGAGWGFTGGAAFQGAAGAAQGLAGIPVVGGMLAGQFSNLMGAAQEAMAYQETKYQMEKFRGFGAQYGRTVGVTETPEQVQARVSSELARLGEARRRPGAREAQGGVEAKYAQVKDIALRAGMSENVADNLAMEIADRTKGAAARSQFPEAVLPAGFDKPRTTYKTVGGEANPFELLGRVGTQYGMDPNQAAQFAGQLLETAGGSFRQLNEQNTTFAMGLQGRFGIGPEATGMFMRGARKGGTTGEDAEQTLMAAVRGGLTLGLEGSDLTSYMQDMASRIAQWDQTGMPVDVESATKFSAAVAGTGLGGVRGAAVAGGLLGVGRQIGTGGAQNAAQFLIARKLFGYQGGGPDAYFDMMTRAGKGEVVEGGMESLLSQFTKGRSAKANALNLQQFLGQVGVTIGTEEALRMVSGDQDTIQKLQGSLARNAQAAMGYTATDVRAEGAAPGAMQGAAANRARRLAAGATAIPGMLEFEEAQTKMLRNASAFSDIIGQLANKASQFSDAMGPGAEKLANVLEQLAVQVGLWKE